MSDDEADYGSTAQSCYEVEEASESEVSQSHTEASNAEAPQEEKDKRISPEESQKRRKDFESKLSARKLDKDQLQWIQVLGKHILHLCSPTGHRGYADTETALGFCAKKDDSDKAAKHMPVIKDQDNVISYLEMEYIDPTNKRQQISFKQIQEIIKVFWEDKYIKKAGKGFQGQYDKKPQTWYLITIGTAHGKEDEEKKENEEEEEEETAKEEVPILISLTNKDIANKQLAISQKIRWKLSSKIVTASPQARIMWRKQTMLNYIKKAFSEAFQMNPKPTRTILYYSGLADEKGHWKCTDDTISIKEILDIAKKEELEEHLEIHSDSDYSGKLCIEAKEWMIEFEEERKEDDDLEWVIKDLQMECSTLKDKKCKKGAHTQMQIDSKDETLTAVQASQITSQYYKKYGKTLYSSTRKGDAQIVERNE